MQNTTQGRIESLQRLKLSVNGNPRFKIFLTDGRVLQTQSDGGINYDIENPEFRDVQIEFALTRAGRVWSATPVQVV
jgi:hypothetical protein